MNLPTSNLNRFLYKTNPTPVDNGPVYMSTDINSKLNANVQPTSTPGNNKDAQNVITGTVITDCIIQTSGLPHRVLIQDNQIIFYDGTNIVNGEASTLVFQSSNNNNGAFTMERRASNVNVTDNVLSWYVTPAVAGSHNWMFIGRDGSASDLEPNLNAMYLAVDVVSGDPASRGNGICAVEIFIDGALPTLFGLQCGDSRVVAGGIGATGTYSTLISSEAGGCVGMSYLVNPTTQIFMWYITNSSYISMGATIIPDTDIAYDIGSATKRVKDVHIGGRLNVGKVTDAGPMTATAGTVGDIVFNTSNLKFYGCTVTGSPATWAALN
jgi:hypothetical protein